MKKCEKYQFFYGYALLAQKGGDASNLNARV